MKYLFLIGQNYTFEILRPIQELALNRGDQVVWYAYSPNVNISAFSEKEIYVTDAKEAVKYAPDACFAPGNIAPNFISGIKVQVFHGLEWKKKGHFRIRDCFDLYCTQGPLFTEKFAELAKQHGNFDVVETGWPKLDAMFKAETINKFTNNEQKTIIYAPTFSPSLTSIQALKQEISRLKNKWHWIIKFHPKTPQDWVDEYRQFESETFEVATNAPLLPLLQQADVMVSDTSSIITEFMMLNKPVVTLNNVAPEPSLINITQSSQLEKAIEDALTPSSKRQQAIKEHVLNLHPYNDGKSAERVLAAADNLINNGKKSNSLPINLFRNIKMRFKFNYWPWR